MKTGRGLSLYVRAMDATGGVAKAALTYAKRRKRYRNTPHVVRALAFAAGAADSGLFYNAKLADEFRKALRPKKKK